MTDDVSPVATAADQVMLVVRLDLRAGAQPQMRHALEQLANETRRKDRGVVRFEVGLDPSDDTRVVGYEVWDSEAALEEHSAKQHTQAFLARARDLTVDPSRPIQAERWRPFSREVPADYAAAADERRLPAPLPDGFRGERRRLGDAEMHYVLGGSGPLLVLLHGFPNTWYAWSGMMPELARTMTVLALDLRGLGDSEPGELPCDLPTGAHDLSLLLRELDADPAVVAGQDWGGSTAFAFAAAHPQAVSALAVIEAMPRGPWTDPDAAAPWFVDFQQIPAYAEQVVRGRERAYLDWFYRTYSATSGVPHEVAVDEYLRTYSRPGVMAAAFERYRATDREVEHNTRYARNRIDTPVLAIGGERAFGAAVAANMRGAATRVREAVIENCGHYVSEERPHELATLLLEFIEDQH